MGSLNVSCALWSLTTGPTEEALTKALETVARMGVKAVQPWCVDVAKWKIVCLLDPDRCIGGQRAFWRNRIASFGLAISGLCAQLTGPDEFGSFTGSDGLEERIRKTQASLRLGVDLGSPIVTTHIGEIPSDRKSPLYRHFLEAVKAVARAGEECGGIFAMETGQESAQTLKLFIEDVGSPAVKVNYDPANMLPWGPAEGVEVLRELIVHAHAKDMHPQTKVQTVGKGAVPWDAYLAEIKRIGYTGWHALEDESGMDTERSLAEGLAYLSRY
jgi:L-ribulose-5-phosphate 3-epimerase